jgi:hypothetical protein
LTARLGAVAVVALAVLAISGCGGHKSAACKPPTGTGPRTGAATGQPVSYLTAVEPESDDCVDRVTFEFRDEGRHPGFRVQYLPASQAQVQDGSGAHVPVAGSAFLVVRMEPAATAEAKGDQLHFTYTGPRRIRVDDGRHLREVVKTGDFEAAVTWVLGLSERRPFSADASSSPSRVVVEIG